MNSSFWTAISFFLASMLLLSCKQEDSIEGCPSDEDPTDEEDDSDAVLSIADEALENCVREAIDMPTGDIQVEEVSDLTHLACIDLGIESIEGLEAFVSLESLWLWENSIVDVGPLSELTELESLQLGYNRIEDVSSLSNLSNLTRLGLSSNVVEDTEPLAGLVGVRWLSLDHNLIEDENAAILCDLSELAWLTLEHNSIEDTSVLDCFDFDDLYYGHQNAAQAAPGESNLLRELNPGRSTRDPRVADVPIGLIPIPKATPIELIQRSSIPGTRNTSMLDFALASPNQFEAGSCLYMASTGAMEFLMNQHVPLEDIQYFGDTDLSERYLMNAMDHVDPGDIDLASYYTYTDTFYAYEYFGGSLLDRDYPFMAGYYTVDGDNYIPSDPSNPDSQFSCVYSWIDELPDGWENTLTPTPISERTLISLDPDLNGQSLWNVGLMDRDVVERIKHELDTKRAPVVVLYNHYTYWHTNVIVGYDDEINSDGCPLVDDSLKYFENQGLDLVVDKIEQHMEEQGGCSDNGVFYVRDSIYPGGSQEPNYVYSEEYDYEDKYSKRLVRLSYNWVVYLANHVYSVHRQPQP